MTKDNTHRDQVRAVVLATLMVVSVFGGSVAFAGSAAASVTGIGSASATDINTGATGETQTVSFTPTLDTNSQEETITIDMSNLPSGVSVTGATASVSSSTTLSVTTDASYESGTNTVTLGVTDSDTSDSDETVDVTITYDTTGTNTGSSSIGLPISASSGSGSASPTFAVVDVTAPVISGYSVTNPQNQDVQVTFTTDEQLATVSASVSGAETGSLSGFSSGSGDFTETDNGDGTYTYEATYAGSSDGDYTIALDTAADAAGNDGAGSESGTVTVDTTAPTASLSGPAEGAIVNDASTIEVSLSDTTTSVDSSTISVSLSDSSTTHLDAVGTGDSAVSYTPETLTIDTSQMTLADGTITVDVSASDTDGNAMSSAYSGSFTLDTNSLTVSVDSPADGSSLNGDVTAISGSAADDNDLSKVSVTVTDTDASTQVASSGDLSVTGTSDTWSFSPSISTEANYSVSATVTDSAGNTNTTTTTFTIDKTAPSVSNVNVTQLDADDTVTNGDTINVSAEVTDSIGVDSVTVDASPLGGNNPVQLSQQGSTDVYSATFDVSGQSTGQDSSVSLTVTATDTAGNTNSAGDSVQLDTTAPTIDSFKANYDGSKTVDVYVKASEALDASSITVDLRSSSDETVATLNSFSETADANNYTQTYTFSEKAQEDFSTNLTAAADVAGNSVDSTKGVDDSFAVDTPALDLSIDSPTSQRNLTSTDEFELKYSYSDTNPDSVTVGLSTNADGSSPTYTYEINDSQYANDDTQKTLTIDLSENVEGDSFDLTDGRYYVTVTATDENSGTSSATTTQNLVSIDEESPNFGKPAFGADDTSTTTTNFSIGLSDATTGVDASTIEVVVTEADGKTTTLTTADEGVTFESGEVTVDTENTTALGGDLAEGTVTVDYSAADYLGHSSESLNNEFTINTRPPAIDSVEAEAGENTVTVTFTEPVKANDGTFSSDDFAYTDVSGDGANDVDSVSSVDSEYTSTVEFTLDADVTTSDLGADEINVRSKALSDRDDQHAKSTDAATVALSDSTDPAAPTIGAPNVTAQNEGEYTVSVTADTAATVDVAVKNSSDDVVAQNRSVDLDESSSATVELGDLSDVAEGDLTVVANVTDRGVGLVSVDAEEAIVKDNTSATIESVEADAGSQLVTVTFSEKVTGVSDSTLVLNGASVSNVGGQDGDSTYVVDLVDEVEPSDIDNESVNLSVTNGVEDVNGTDANTSAVHLTDTQPSYFTDASAKNGSTTVDVQFTEMTYDATGGNLTADNFTYVNNSGVSHSVESVEMADDKKSATLTLDTSLTAEDLRSDQLEATPYDSEGNNVSQRVTITDNVDVDDFELTNVSGREVRISFTAYAELGSIDVDLYSTDDLAESGEDDEIADTVDLTEDDFTVEAQEDGTYVYAATYTVPRDGEYNAQLDSATAVSGKEAYESPSDWTNVDTQNASVVDAEIVGADDSTTDVSVQFDEPVDVVGSDYDLSIGGQTVNAHVYDISDADDGVLYFTVSGQVATGDAPSLSVSGDDVEERHGYHGDDAVDADASTTLDTHEFHLQKGVNFVSVPAEFGSLDIASSGFADATVMTYDEGSWHTYNPEKSSDKQDFTELEGGQGYIVETDADATVDVTVRNERSGSTAESATPGQQHLEEGWNLVGHWQEGDQGKSAALGTISESGATHVWGQNSVGDYSYGTVGTFSPGEAYWVFVEDDEVYTATEYGVQ